jgi:hypothetical protein
MDAAARGNAPRHIERCRSSTMLYDCPECGLPAAVTVQGRAAGTDGPVEVVAVRCAARHWFLGPGEALRHRLPAPRRNVNG